MSHALQHRASRSTQPAPAFQRDRGWLVPLLLFFVLKGMLLVAMIGPFTGHDEVDHFYYIARLAAGDGLGVVGEVELPPTAAPYRDYVADYPTNAEVIQPPLYHLLLTPIYLATPGGETVRLAVLRLAAIPLGAMVVWLAYLTARLLFPAELLLRAGVPLFVAFQPQLAFEAAIVNHDILLIALVSLVVYLVLRGLRDSLSPRDEWTIGLVSAAALWTKVSFGLILPVIGLGVIMALRNQGARPRTMCVALGRTLVAPVVAIAPWLLRSFLLYGDPTGAGRLAHIPGFGEQARTYQQMATDPQFWHLLLQDFWANFGWRQIPLDPIGFRVVWLTWGVALTGLLIGSIRAMRNRRDPARPRLDRAQRQGVAIMALSVVVLTFGVFYVGTIQFTQARFAFPAMIGFGVLTMLGVAGWLPTRWRPVALPVVALAMMLLDLLLVLRYLLPFYYGPGGGVAMLP